MHILHANIYVVVSNRDAAASWMLFATLCVAVRRGINTDVSSTA